MPHDAWHTAPMLISSKDYHCALRGAPDAISQPRRQYFRRWHIFCCGNFIVATHSISHVSIIIAFDGAARPFLAIAQCTIMNAASRQDTSNYHAFIHDYARGGTGKRRRAASIWPPGPFHAAVITRAAASGRRSPPCYDYRARFSAMMAVTFRRLVTAAVHFISLATPSTSAASIEGRMMGNALAISTMDTPHERCRAT